MEGLRHALAEYAKEYAKKKAEAKSKNASDAFENMGRAYVRMAIKEPNLFKFLYLGESPIDSPYKIRETPKEIDSGDMIAGISAETGLSPDQAARVMRNTIIYSHGITTMVATGVFKASEKEIMSMIRYASEGFVRIEKEAANG
jgi:hypothetical protein